MLSFLFLTCCFLIIIACSEAAVTDAKKPQTRQTCSTNDFSSGCTLSNFSFSSPLTGGSSTDSQLDSLNQHYSSICTKSCVSAITKYYRCYYSGDQQEYLINLIQKYICGQHSNGDYCPVRLLRGYIGSSTTTTDRDNALALANIPSSCSGSFGTTGITCSGSSTCTNAISTFSQYAGCCTEPFLGPGVRSCSGISVPQACTGVSSATGIMATAPIVAVSLMVFALVGVLL